MCILNGSTALGRVFAVDPFKIHNVQKDIWSWGELHTCAATAAQVVLRPLQQASRLVTGFSPLQLHVGDVPLEQQQVYLLKVKHSHQVVRTDYAQWR